MKALNFHLQDPGVPCNLVIHEFFIVFKRKVENFQLRSDRAEILRRLGGLDGVYVPALYQWHEATGDRPARWETTDEKAPFPVRRVWVDRLDSNDQPEVALVPFADVIQDRLGMEIMRGCTQGCRFCQAGYWYRPVREHDPEVVLERMRKQVAETGFEEVGLLSLSTADYSQVEPLVYNLARCLEDQRVSIGHPADASPFV